jgi:hypothetical protein
MIKWLEEHAALIGIVIVIAYEIRRQKRKPKLP